MKKLLLLLWLQIRRHWSCGQGPQCSAHGCQGCGPGGVGFKSMLGEGREKEKITWLIRVHSTATGWRPLLSEAGKLRARKDNSATSLRSA